MSSSYTVGYIIGSLSTESINRTLSKALIRLAPENLTLVEIPIRDLPVYNRDFDADYPPAGRALKNAIASVVRTIGGLLKDAGATVAPFQAFGKPVEIL